MLLLQVTRIHLDIKLAKKNRLKLIFIYLFSTRSRAKRSGRHRKTLKNIISKINEQTL